MMKPPDLGSLFIKPWGPGNLPQWPEPLQWLSPPQFCGTAENEINQECVGKIGLDHWSKMGK
jgi:hypothetical protein